MMRHIAPLLLALAVATAVALGATPAHARSYAPLGDYLMQRDAEIALARSAAPGNVAGRATIKVLTESGYQVAHEGDNGFVCLVERGWSAPTWSPPPFRDFVYDATLRAPICYNPIAARSVLPYKELRARLGMRGKSPDEIAAGVESAYARGELPRIEGVGFAYMFSADMQLGPGIGHFHPHVMVYTPYYDNAMLGNNAFGGMEPFVSDDAGTPFAVTVIPVDPKLAVHAAVAR